MITAIFAADKLGGIGYQGTLPWPKSTEDFKWFKSKTANNIVVMGRNTWNDPKFPKPLPNRINVVVTSSPITETDDVIIMAGDIEPKLRALQETYPEKEIFLIGGKHLLESHWHLVTRIYLTTHPGEYEADVFLNLTALLRGFRAKGVQFGKTCTFTEYVKSG